jgi:hypothetical protein
MTRLSFALVLIAAFVLPNPLQAKNGSGLKAVAPPTEATRAAKAKTANTKGHHFCIPANACL